MFKLDDIYEFDRKTLSYDYMRYSPAKTALKNTPKMQVYIKTPREDSVVSLINSFPKLNFEVIEKAYNFRYGNGNDEKFVSLESIALFSNFRLTASSGKHLEDVGHAHFISIMYKRTSSAKDAEDLSISFDRSRDRRKQKLTNNKNVKMKYYLRIMLKDIFGFAEHKEKLLLV